MSPRIVGAATLWALFAGSAPAAAQDQPIAPETNPTPAPAAAPDEGWTTPSRTEDDNWGSLIHHGQRASGEESLQQLEARTVAREEVYDRRRGLSIGLGAELVGASGHTINDGTRDAYGHLASDFGAAAAASLRYGFGLVALEGAAHLGAGVYATELSSYDYETGQNHFYEDGGLAPMLGGRLGGRLYFGTLPAFAALHASADVHLLGDFGAQAAFGLDAALGLVLGPEEQWEVSARFSISDFADEWDAHGAELWLGLTYWLPRA